MDKLADEMWELRAQLTRITAERDDALAIAGKLNSGAELQDLMKLNNQLVAERDGLRKVLEEVENLHYYVNNPSAWDTFDDGMSERIRTVAHAASNALAALTPAVSDAHQEGGK